jgi:DNA-binding transcriptional LysR family regulator
MVARPLAQNRRVMCASPAYLAARPPLTHPNDLARCDLIAFTSSPTLSQEWRFTRGHETASYIVPLNGIRETNDGAIAREWAVNGHGIVMKSLWDVGADLRAGRLQIALPDWRTPDVPVYAIYQRSRYMAPRTRALLDFLLERFADASRELDPFF